MDYVYSQHSTSHKHHCSLFVAQVIDCGAPPQTSNGQVSALTTTFQSTASYTCNAGYEFASQEQQITRMCQANGVWSDSTPQCQRTWGDACMLFKVLEALVWHESLPFTIYMQLSTVGYHRASTTASSLLQRQLFSQRLRTHAVKVMNFHRELKKWV